MLIKLASIFGESTDYLLTGNRPENKSAHDDLGLSDKAIERLKSLHSNKELLLPFVDALLSKSELYNAFYSATKALVELHRDFKQKCE